MSADEKTTFTAGGCISWSDRGSHATGGRGYVIAVRTESPLRQHLIDAGVLRPGRDDGLAPIQITPGWVVFRLVERGEPRRTSRRLH